MGEVTVLAYRESCGKIRLSKSYKMTVKKMKKKKPNIYMNIMYVAEHKDR